MEDSEQPAGNISGFDNTPEEIFNGRDVSATNLARIKSSYRGNGNGVVCIQFLSKSADKCNDLVLEQWHHVLLKQEWTVDSEYRIR